MERGTVVDLLLVVVAVVARPLRAAGAPPVETLPLGTGCTLACMFAETVCAVVAAPVAVPLAVAVDVAALFIKDFGAGT
jgi:hypothetical protein